jgi:hypothetical protein
MNPADTKGFVTIGLRFAGTEYLTVTKDAGETASSRVETSAKTFAVVRKAGCGDPVIGA